MPPKNLAFTRSIRISFTQACIPFGALLLTSTPCFAVLQGYVTPAKVTMTVTSIGLLDAAAGATVNISTTSTEISFSATDSDLAQTKFSTISIPEGRYLGAVIGYSTNRSITLNGYKYQGVNGTAGSDGQYMCSSTTGYTFQNTATCTSPTALALTINGGANRSYFASPICITTTAKQAATCKTGDTFLDAGTASNLTINVMLDLYNTLSIDPDGYTANIVNNQGNLYPYITLGGPGAAVHLSSHAAGNVAQNEITLLFDGSKKLINTFTFGPSSAGFCGGTGYVTATAAPTGSVLNTWGPTFVGSYNSTTGKAAFISNGAVGTAGTSTGGIMVLGDLRKVAGSAISMNCYADSDTAHLTAWDPLFPAYLGFAYGAGPGASDQTTSSINLVKMTDPSGIFGVATCTSGTTTGCGAYPN